MHNEAALGGVEEQYRLLMECVRDHAIFLLDPEGRLATWNVGAERVFGYTEAEAVGMDAAGLFTPEDIEQGVPRQELETAAAQGRAGDDRWHIHKDGSRIWVNGVVNALRDERGQ